LSEDITSKYYLLIDAVRRCQNAGLSDEGATAKNGTVHGEQGGPWHIPPQHPLAAYYHGLDNTSTD